MMNSGPTSDFLPDSNTNSATASSFTQLSNPAFNDATKIETEESSKNPTIHIQNALKWNRRARCAPPTKRAPNMKPDATNVATQAAASGQAPVAGQNNDGLVNKKAIASRYGISPRKVDYLREQKILPWYELPPRCIRFKPSECDAAIAHYRRGGVGAQTSGRQ